LRWFPAGPAESGRHCERLEGGGLQGRGELRRQRRSGREVQGETGINVYKWDVSSFDACSEGIKKVEADLGPVEVLVNNAGITRDAMLHR
jgi:acetoacetyl-CoA reductase